MSKGICPKCKKGEMLEQELSENLSVSPNDFELSSIPLSVFRCNKCGYIEFYAE